MKRETITGRLVEDKIPVYFITKTGKIARTEIPK